MVFASMHWHPLILSYHYHHLSNPFPLAVGWRERNLVSATMVIAAHYCYLFSIPPPPTRKITTVGGSSSTSRVRVVDSSPCSTASALFHDDHRTTLRMTLLLRRRRGAAAADCGGGASVGVVMMNLITEPEYFQVGRLIGSYGFINITSYSAGGLQSPQYYTQDQEDPTTLGSLKLQDVGEGNVKIRLYEGRLVQGSLRGTPVIFKVYPGQQVGGIEADTMAANELDAHASLQQEGIVCENIQLLLGGFETTTGEQWLAFRNHGIYTAADYARVTSEKMSKVSNQLWNPFERDLTLQRRRIFVTKLLQGTMKALSYMHDHHRLHQSVGPYSVVLNTMVEKEAAYLVPRLRDLAFSVDIRYPQLQDDSKTLSQGLWRRAALAGAFTPLEKRAFGIADDIYEAGLLFAYLAFVPFCEAGIMDSLSLRRLLENTFQLDVEAIKEYCLADDRLSEAVRFLDLNDNAGWELLQAMLDGDFRKRPAAEAVLTHRFFTGGL